MTIDLLTRRSSFSLSLHPSPILSSMILAIDHLSRPSSLLLLSEEAANSAMRTSDTWPHFRTWNTCRRCQALPMMMALSEDVSEGIGQIWPMDWSAGAVAPHEGRHTDHKRRAPTPRHCLLVPLEVQDSGLESSGPGSKKHCCKVGAVQVARVRVLTHRGCGKRCTANTWTLRCAQTSGQSRILQRMVAQGF